MLTTYRNWLRLLLLIHRRCTEQWKNEVLPALIRLRAFEIMIRFLESSREKI